VRVGVSRWAEWATAAEVAQRAVAFGIAAVSRVAFSRLAEGAVVAEQMDRAHACWEERAARAALAKWADLRGRPLLDHMIEAIATARPLYALGRALSRWRSLKGRLQSAREFRRAARAKQLFVRARDAGREPRHCDPPQSPRGAGEGASLESRRPVAAAGLATSHSGGTGERRAAASAPPPPPVELQAAVQMGRLRALRAVESQNVRPTIPAQRRSTGSLGGALKKLGGDGGRGGGGLTAVAAPPQRPLQPLQEAWVLQPSKLPNRGRASLDQQHLRSITGSGATPMLPYAVKIVPEGLPKHLHAYDRARDGPHREGTHRRRDSVSSHLRVVPRW
jgi:hypothetical protein